MRALWGKQIDTDDENREFMRALLKRAAVPLEELKFPPLCPTCLAEGPDGAYPLHVREGQRAGLVRPIYVPHCRHCSIRGRYVRVNLWKWLLLVLSVIVLGALALYYLFLKEYPQQQPESRLLDLLKYPLTWMVVVALGVAAYFLQRRGISIHGINESAIIFSFLHQQYCDRFREINRIGVRKRAEELKEWEAGYCPGCGRPVGRSHDYCPYCGRLVKAAEPAEAGVAEEAVSVSTEAVAERATSGGQAISDWPKVIYCDCGRKYRFRRPGTYQCIDASCGKVFVL